MTSLPLTRRHLLAGTSSVLALFSVTAHARTYGGGTGLPWEPNGGEPPLPINPQGWLLFTPAEARMVEGIADRMIPADTLSIGGKEAGCAVFVDRQLAGWFGQSTRLYMRPPFMNGLPTQGLQSPNNPILQYRTGLAALEAIAKKQFSNRSFTDLKPDEQDSLLKDMEAGKLEVPDGYSSKAIFDLMLQNIMEGFFADPIYGGNKDLASWKMLGFAGTRYDHRDFVDKHNQKYPLPPVSIAGRARI